MATCWKCKPIHPYFIYDRDYKCLKCFYCGRTKDGKHEANVDAKRKLNQLRGTESNIQSDGGDKDYPFKKRWSMKD